MKRKKLLICFLLAAESMMSASVSAWDISDLISNNIMGVGYQLGITSNSSTIHGVFASLNGFFASINYTPEYKEHGSSTNSLGYTTAEWTYTWERSDFTFGYDFRITDWLYVPLGIGTSTKSLIGTSHSGYGPIEEPKHGSLFGINFGVGFTFDGFTIRTTTTNFNTFFLGIGIRIDNTRGAAPKPIPAPRPVPAPQPTPAPQPRMNPTITPEELRRVELAYEETVRDIRRRGKQLYINNISERSAFIRQYQGNPAAESVRVTRDRKLPYYNIREVSQEDIVALAKRETNDFLKVRMIHDWVSDVFSYDYDLLYWMDNVSGQNAEFTLGKIIERQRGVCFEYAILFWFLADAAGLDTYLICDSSKPGVGHAYNMVVINNTGYIIDTTWDSGNLYQSSRIIQFDRMISKDYFMPSVSQSYRLRGW
jgi:hypothetical protein